MMVHTLAKEIVSRRFSSSVNVYAGEGIILALYYDGVYACKEIMLVVSLVYFKVV
jgi:hypothetical protein